MDVLHIFLIITNLIAIGGLVFFARLSFNMERKMDIYEEWIVRFRTQIEYVYTRMKEVDDRNLFDKDDDVGFVFTELLRITQEFDESVKLEHEEETQSKK